MHTDPQHDTSDAVPRPDSKTGRWTVLAMFGFGGLMVLTLWVYWEAYTRPFRPLQYALAAEFPGSSPRVIGGRHKSHKAGAVNTLRVVARVPDADFDLSTETERAEARALRIAQVVLKTQDLTDYEMLEIRLIQRVPEQETRQWFVERTPSEWKGLSPAGETRTDPASASPATE